MEGQERAILRKTADLITALKKAVFGVYEQDYHQTKIIYHDNIPVLGEVMKYMLTVGSDAGIQLQASIEYLRDNGLKDIILFGDIVEKDLIPSLERCAFELGGQMQINEEDYSIEATASGYFTLKKGDVYLHSNDNPMIAAWHLAKGCFLPQADSYAVFGCGLGYHLLELYRISTGAVKIYAYEPDEKVIEYGRCYGVLGEIPEEVLHIVHDPDMMEFLLHSQNENIGVMMHLPTITAMSDENLKKIAEELYIHWNTQRQFETIQTINLRQNQKNCKKYLEELAADDRYEEAVIVAAGPSLDSCMDWLHQQQGRILIVAVSTVFQKLQKAGIRPDYITVMDPQKRTLGHLEGLMQETVPMIVAPYAYWEFAKCYQGEKYLACFKEEGKKGFQIGGTVTTLALETAIYLGVKKIYLAGVDMAFPGGVTHADGTMDQSRKDLSKLTPVVGVGGQTVYTDEAFAIYKEWIERRIRENPQITYINLSTVGARIEGTIEEKIR